MAAATKETRFQWNKGDKIKNLIHCLANFNAQMEYKNNGFNADKVKQYEAVREAMARIYEEETTFFGSKTGFAPISSSYRLLLSQKFEN